MYMLRSRVMRKLAVLVFCSVIASCSLCDAQRIFRVAGVGCPNCKVTQMAPVSQTATEPVVVEQTTQQVVETTQSFRQPTQSVCSGSGCFGAIRSRASRGSRWTPFANVFGRAPDRIQSRAARRSRELRCVTGNCYN